MNIDGRGGAEVRRLESRQDHRPGEFEGSESLSVCEFARRHRVRELSLCPSACFCEDLLQLKCVTSCCCPVLGATEGLDVRMAKLKRIVGQGPVKGSLLDEDLALHGTMW
jgi:hypothetical protein